MNCFNSNCRLDMRRIYCSTWRDSRKICLESLSTITNQIKRYEESAGIDHHFPCSGNLVLVQSLSNSNRCNKLENISDLTFLMPS